MHRSCPPGNPAAYKGAFSVSYNRPFDGTITQDNGRSYLFYAEYQMIRFVERNGYDVSYTSQIDADANPALLRNHKVIVSSGHDEYWSARERANVEAARDAGVSLAFFSGNEVFWKTRFSALQRRRHLDAQPHAHQLQGHALRRRHRPGGVDRHLARPALRPARRRRAPENSLTGQLFIINSGSADITVPSTYKNLRLWRNTAVANLGAGQSRTLAPGNRRSATSGISTPTTASARAASSSSRRRP